MARTIGISLLDFTLFPEQPDLHSRFRPYNERHGQELSDVFELHFIELTKFRQARARELTTPFDAWLHVLKFGETYEAGPGTIPEELKREEGVEMALKAMWEASSSEQVRELVEAKMKAKRDWTTAGEHAERKGREEGEKVGREEERKLLARRLLAGQMGAGDVARLTGLSTEEVEALRQG